MWKLDPRPEYLRRVKEWPKKYHWELVAVHDNLDTFLRGLNIGLTLGRVRAFGFVHDERNGLLTLVQNGGGGSEWQTRLYVYANDRTRMIEAITLGDERTRLDDLRLAKQRVETIRWEEAQHHEQEEHLR